MSFMKGSHYTASLSDDELDRLVAEAKDFAFNFGVLMRTRNNMESADDVAHAPFTLFPSPVPRQCYLDAQTVHTDFNLLMHRVARDSEFLFQCLKSVIETDEFTRRLWKISETVNGQKRGVEGPVQPIALEMNRSDYMIGTVEKDIVCASASTTESGDKSNGCQCPASRQCDVTGRSGRCATNSVSLMQTEFNTMSAGAAGLAGNANKLHRFLLDRNPSNVKSCDVPENHAVSGLANAMVRAWQLYGNPSSVILFLVYEVEPNIYDQRWHEYSIWKINSTVRVIRRTLNDVKLGAQLTADNRLIIDEMEVAVVYMRSCYKPSDYKTDDDWNARLMMESSKAIVCPTAAYQLAGTKKVQQMLVKRGAVERFVDDEAAVRRIRSTFVDQFSLDLDDEGEKNAQWAADKPHLFVMKPQREGGGNNVFGEAIRSELFRLKNTSERSSFILMRKIIPMTFRNYAVAWRQKAELQELVSELGFYGTLIADGDNVIENKQHGFLMRTKRVGVNEGGLMSGSAFLDSPHLVD